MSQRYVFNPKECNGTGALGILQGTFNDTWPLINRKYGQMLLQNSNASQNPILLTDILEKIEKFCLSN